MKAQPTYDQLVQRVNDLEAEVQRARALLASACLPVVASDPTATLPSSRQAEEALINQSILIGSLLEAASTPIYYKDANGIYLGCNAAFEAFLGRPRSAIIGRTVFDIAPSDLAGVYHEKDLEIISQKGSQTYASEVVTAQGKRSVIFHKATFQDNRGQPAGLVGVITDITDTKKAERALARSEKQYRLLIETSLFGVLVTSVEDGKVLFANESTCRFFGVPADRIGEVRAMDFWCSPDDRRRIVEQITAKEVVTDL